MLLDNTRLISVWDILNVDVRSDISENSPLFKGMKIWQIRKIIAIGEITQFNTDKMIVRQGTKIKNLYVVLEGAIESWRTRNDGSAFSTGITSYGGVFGMMFPESKSESTSNMIAMSETKVLVLKWEDIHQIHKLYPRLGLKLLNNVSSIASDMLNLYEKTSESLTDELSGTYNYSVFKEILKSHLHRAVRFGEQFSVVVISFDTLKEAVSNDYSGIEYSIKVRYIASMIRLTLRPSDIIGRWNGFALCIASPMTSKQEAEIFIQRIEEQFSDKKKKYKINIDYLSLKSKETSETFMQNLNKLHRSELT